MELEKFKSHQTGKEEIFARFTRHEAAEVAAMAKRRISDLRRAKQRVEDNPNNEGQAHYQERVNDLRWAMEFCQELSNLMDGLKQ